MFKSPPARLCALATVLVFGPPVAQAAPDAALKAAAESAQSAVIESLHQMVLIESGSADLAGLARMADLVDGRLKTLGFATERHKTTAGAGADIVVGRIEGTGSKRFMLQAHMDTVYLRGMAAKQPFRIDGNRAYGLGIGDDKAGVAVILHTIASLQALGFKGYGLLTVLINGDEEISSPGARATLPRLGAEHDLTLSHEGSPANSDQLSLATAGIAAVTLKVTGKASHAGGAPERGLNAIYELAHQMLQTKDFSDPSRGLKMNSPVCWLTVQPVKQRATSCTSFWV